jgi:hypothetical protein
MAPDDIPSPDSFGSINSLAGNTRVDPMSGYPKHEAARLSDRSGLPQAGTPMGPASDNWSRLPGYGQDKIYEKADGSYGNASGDGRDEVNPAVDYDWNSLLGSYEDIARMTQETTDLYDQGQGGPQVSIGAPPPQTFSEFGTGRDSSGGAGGGYGGVVYQGPVFDYPELNLPEPFEYGASLDLPDYTPPEYDEGKERSIREEFIQTNKGALSKAAQQAILGSANVNNPQARGAIIKAALEGFGESLGQTALRGSQEGRRGAEAEYARDVGVYNTQFDVQSKETLAGYDQDMREDLMNWELELSTAQADYGNQLALWDRMPGDIQAQNMPS